MYQGYLSSVASQCLKIYVNLTLPGIDELIQITTGSESGMGGSRLWDFEGVCRRIGTVIADEIFDVSNLFLFCGLTIVMQIDHLMAGSRHLIFEKVPTKTLNGLRRQYFSPIFSIFQ